VLQRPYTAQETRIIVREMVDALVLGLVEKGLMTDQIVLHIGYDIENITDANRRSRYRGPIDTDRYGRQVPRHAHGTVNLEQYTSSTKRITEKTLELYDRIINKNLLVRRLYLNANRLLTEQEAAVFRRGRNMGHGNVPKGATVAEYRNATGMEVLAGYLHVSGEQERLCELLSAAFTFENTDT
jgi:hypothetical protein